MLRVAVLLAAVLLGLQCVWLLAAELVRPGIDKLPTDIASAAVAAKQREAAFLAASIGAIRGDLWAESAYTNADLLWGKKGARENEDLTETLPRARASLDHALDASPHLSSAWLLLAGLASRFPSLGFDATEALKTSYYTGPSEQDLIPLRLRIAVHSDRFSDVEIRQFVGRDIHFLLARKEKPAISEAYGAASSAWRSFIEQTVRDIDPSALGALGTGTLKQPLPD
jgi:hypothetical protein